jgi:hypothetical protein
MTLANVGMRDRFVRSCHFVNFMKQFDCMISLIIRKGISKLNKMDIFGESLFIYAKTHPPSTNKE